MKGIVVYKSKSGFTKHYAEWIAEELDFALCEHKQMSSVQLEDYDCIIYGGGVYAGKISGLKTMLQRVRKMDDLHFTIFAVGALPPEETMIEDLKRKNLEETGFDYPFFYMHGGFDPEKLNVFLKLVLKGVSKSMHKKEQRKPDELTDDERSFMEFFESRNSNVDIRNIKDLVEHINSIV